MVVIDFVFSMWSFPQSMTWMKHSHLIRHTHAWRQRWSKLLVWVVTGMDKKNQSAFEMIRNVSVCVWLSFFGNCLENQKILFVANLRVLTKQNNEQFTQIRQEKIFPESKKSTNAWFVVCGLFESGRTILTIEASTHFLPPSHICGSLNRHEQCLLT